MWKVRRFEGSDFDVLHHSDYRFEIAHILALETKSSDWPLAARHHELFGVSIAYEQLQITNQCVNRRLERTERSSQKKEPPLEERRETKTNMPLVSNLLWRKEALQQNYELIKQPTDVRGFIIIPDVDSDF